jgi:signal transduction histidine kinase
MQGMRTATSEQGPEHAPVWRDMALVIAVTLCGGMLAAYLELSEFIFAWTRGLERWQIDELPAVLTVLSVGLVWFAWRRYQVARVELIQRRAAEARLEKLLLDNRRFARQFLHLQESERKSLARELHDELGQYLNAVKIDAVSVQQRLDPGSPLLRPASAIIEHIDHISTVVRDLIGELRPVGLDELGLRAALEHCVADWRRRLPQVHFEVALAGDVDSLDEAVALTIYRLVQEGLTNVSKHAHARRVDIHVRRVENEVDDVICSIVDDGDGADLSGRSAGLGLVGMRERVEMLGGRVEVTTSPGRGFAVRTELPAMQAP